MVFYHNIEMVKKETGVRKVLIEKDSYYDSVFLMLISREVKKIPGVRDAVVSMGTEANRELLKKVGFLTREAEQAAPNDLIIAVEGDNDEAVSNALQSARELLISKKSEAKAEEEYRPVSLDTAFKMLPDSNLVIISVPGIHAAREAKIALENDRHVMLFSDNVSLEDEIELKKLAVSRGLLMMGPDCGTAIINGKPLCFANVVRRGNIGVAAASGTGLQEVTCSIDRQGGGISQAIGTGGRDLMESSVGGMMMLLGIEALKNDPATGVIVVISKPPAEDTAKNVISKLNETGKPCVIHFTGMKSREQSGNLRFAGNLEAAASMAAALSSGREYRPSTFTLPALEIEQLVKHETAGMSRPQRYLRGLFTGGTLADEALILFEWEIGSSCGVYSNIHTIPERILKDPDISKAHTIVDMGDDLFTAGRPHPMIDPSLREKRILKEMHDPEVALFLLDIVLGYGSHVDPAGAIIESLKEAKKQAKNRGGYLSIVASITGTRGDFQNMEEQKKTLESIGCVVMPSNYQASMLALEIIGKAA